MRKIEGARDGRGNPAAPPVFVIRVEGTEPKPKRRWLRIWAALMALGLIVGAAAALTNPNAPRELPSCNEVDADAVRCDHFWLRPPSDSR